MVKLIFKITQFIISIIVLLLMLSCGNSINTFNDGIAGNGTVLENNRTISEKFDAIDVKTGVNVIIEQNEVASITVKTDENLQNHLKTEVSNGILSIYFDESIQSSTLKTVTVAMPILKKIETSSGASVQSTNIIKTEQLDLKSSSGSEILVQLNTKNLFCDSSSGSTIQASGKSENLKTESSSGSSQILNKLEANHAICNSSSGSSTKVYPLESLNAVATSGSSIRYYYSPKQIKIEENSGGNVSQK